MPCGGGFHPRLNFLPTHRNIIRPKCSYHFCRETGHLNEFHYKMKSVRSFFSLLLNPHCCATKSNSKIVTHWKFIMCMICSVENVQFFIIEWKCWNKLSKIIFECFWIAIHIIRMIKRLQKWREMERFWRNIYGWIQLESACR